MLRQIQRDRQTDIDKTFRQEDRQATCERCLEEKNVCDGSNLSYLAPVI